MYFHSSQVHVRGSKNYAGISHPVVDALLDKLLAAQTRNQQVAATRALDRVLLSQHYSIPNWYSDHHRVAWRNRFDHTSTPPYTLGLRAWAAHEAIAAGVYLLERHPDDPAAAILEGANTPGDSDSIATLAGALVGARRGLASLPADWVRDVERSDELLALAAAI